MKAEPKKRPTIGHVKTEPKNRPTVGLKTTEPRKVCVAGTACNYTMATALRMTVQDYDAACEALKRRQREGPNIDQFLGGPRALSPPGTKNGLKFIHIPKTGGTSVECATQAPLVKHVVRGKLIKNVTFHVQPFPKLRLKQLHSDQTNATVKA